MNIGIGRAYSFRIHGAGETKRSCSPLKEASPMRYATLLALIVLNAPIARAASLGDRIPQLPATPYDYTNLTLPAHFFTVPPPGGPPGSSSVVSNDNTPADNPTTDDGATLGRVLFYDTNLSLNRTIACASCHKQANGFSDPATLSVGFDGGSTRRHSMGLTNARYFARERAFWDERALSLEDQALKPIQDSVEMGLTLTELVTRVNALSYYDELFLNTFGDDTATTDRIAKALAQFDRSLVSYNSRYDVARAQVTDPNPPFPGFTPQENMGKQIFNGPGRCITCHITESQINANVAPFNNGLDVDTSEDEGVFETTGLPQHRGAFKVPSLRNIGVRAPYMHDGRFASLAEVVEFYNSGIQPHVNLAPQLRAPGGEPIRLNLTQAEKDALVAFLHTLTDTAFLADERFDDPFVFPPEPTNAVRDWVYFE